MIAPPYVARRWDPMASRLALGAKNVNQEIPRSLLRGYLAKGRGGRNRGVSPTMPFRLIPRSLLRGGFMHLCNFLGIHWLFAALNHIPSAWLACVIVGADARDLCADNPLHCVPDRVLSPSAQGR